MTETAGETAARVARGIARGLQMVDDYDEFVRMLKRHTEMEITGWGSRLSVKRPIIDAIPYLDFRTIYNNRGH